MKYFYAYVNTSEKYKVMIDEVKKMNPEIKDSSIYIDTKSCSKWKSLMHKLKNNDELYFNNMSSIACDEYILYENLSTLNQFNINIKLLDETLLSLKQLLDLIDFVRSTQWKRNYEKQMEGIHKALEKKKNGLGAYGRPKIILPDDFEDNIKKIMRKEMKHEDYRQELGYKRSTYFKFVKELKDMWKQQEIERK